MDAPMKGSKASCTSLQEIDQRVGGISVVANQLARLDEYQISDANACHLEGLCACIRGTAPGLFSRRLWRNKAKEASKERLRHINASHS